MGRVLTVYDTTGGSTAEIAGILAGVFRKRGQKVDLCRVREIDTLAPYDGVLLGSPIQLEKCTQQTKDFLVRHRRSLQGKNVACFLTCLLLAREENEPPTRFPVYIDPSFHTRAKSRNRMSSLERTHSSSHYMNLFLGIAPEVRPVGFAFFKGRLDYGKLGLSHRALLRLVSLRIPEIRQGDYLNPDSVRAWAEMVYPLLTQ